MQQVFCMSFEYTVSKKYEKQRTQRMSVCQKIKLIRFLNIAQEYQKEKNIQKIDEMIQQLKENEQRFPEDDFQFWKQNFAGNRGLIFAQNEKIQKKLQQIQANIFTNIKQLITQESSQLMKSYTEESSVNMNASDLEENRGEKWAKFLSLCLPLKKAKDKAVFEVNSKIMSQARAEIAEFNENFKQTGESLLKTMNNIIMNPLNEKEVVSDTFKNIPQLKSDIYVLHHRDFVELYGKKEIQSLGINFFQALQKIIDFVNSLLEKNFVIADKNAKEFDEKFEENRIEEIEKTLSILKLFQEPYNLNLSPPTKIIFDDFRNTLQESKEKTINQFKQYLNKWLESEESDGQVHKRILYILRLFAKVAEKPREFLEDFQLEYEKCLSLMRERLKQKMMEISKARQRLLVDQFNEFISSDHEKLSDQFVALLVTLRKMEIIPFITEEIAGLIETQLKHFKNSLKIIGRLNRKLKNRQPKLTEQWLKKNTFKIALLIDGTGSMDQLFTQLQSILPTIFDRIYEKLEKFEYIACFEMQIVLYRNYNSEFDKILEYSSFYSQSNNLKNFIKNREVDGGWGNQAIQVALQYANSLPELNEIIVIGDARGNTKEEIQTKRILTFLFQSDLQDLQLVRFEKGMLPTCTEDEIEKLKNKKIKVHGFYLSSDTEVKDYFDEICQKTGGESKYIDVTESTAPDEMTEFIVTRALTLIGRERKGADELFEAYRKQLIKKMGTSQLSKLEFEVQLLLDILSPP